MIFSFHKGGISPMVVTIPKVYSLLQKAPGTLLDHEATLRALINKITSSHMVQQQGYQFDIPGFVTEWVH